MTHYISLCTKPGNKATSATKIELHRAVSALANSAKPTKDGSYLIFNGYSDNQEVYSR